MEEEEEYANRLCFVVGPIGAEDSTDRIHADWLLEMIILPVMEHYPQFEVKRADKISEPGMIDAQIINALLNADLVIADLSTLNPNAFYEIGIRHMIQKPIIHMQVVGETIPFDVSLFRSIKYSRQRPRDLKAAQASLKLQVDAILAGGYQVDNPVTRTRGAVALEQGATSGEKVLLEQIRAMEARIAQLENGFPIPRNTRPSLANLTDFATNTITFRNRKGFTDRQNDMINKVLINKFGFATVIARNGTTLVVAVPSSADPTTISFPPGAGMGDVEVEFNTKIEPRN